MKGNFMKATILCLIAGLTLSGGKKNGTVDEGAMMKITMTTAATADEVRIFLVGSGTAVVDLGDGNSMDLALGSKGKLRGVARTYVASGSRTIKIAGMVTRLVCSNNRLTALDASKNTAPTHIQCNGNRLTALDVSKNTAPTNLFCHDNQLTADALNALFGTLPDNTREKPMSMYENPGSADCDKTIAKQKGWIVW